MAQIISSQYLFPDSKTHEAAILQNHTSLARSMNRAGHLIAMCLDRLEPNILELLKTNSQQTALYSVLDQSSGSHENILGYIKDSSRGLAASFSKNIPPKFLLKQTIGLTASTLSILYHIEGGTHTFHHTQWACYQALNQAKIDLKQGIIKYAVLAAVSTQEDPMVTHFRTKTSEPQTYKEGVGLVVLTTGDEATSFNFSLEASNNNFNFGIADPLIKTLLQGRKN